MNEIPKENDIKSHVEHIIKNKVYHVRLKNPNRMCDIFLLKKFTEYFYNSKNKLCKKYVNKKLLITICSRNPTITLIRNIIYLNKIFVNYQKKICIIDSDSTDFTVYNIISKKYPLIDIHFIKNKNYEYGAYKYSYSKYANYDIYCCIQDGILFINNIDISEINDDTAFIFYDNSGFNSHLQIKSHAINLLKNVDLDYQKIIDTNFTLATFDSFIVTNSTIKNIFEVLINPPISKEGSCSYERLFGLYFIIKKYKTINIRGSIKKIYGGRI